MRLPPVPHIYVPDHLRELQRQIEAADRATVKEGRDHEVGSGRVILTAPNGTRWALQVSDAGALSAVAL